MFWRKKKSAARLHLFAVLTATLKQIVDDLDTHLPTWFGPIAHKNPTKFEIAALLAIRAIRYLNADGLSRDHCDNLLQAIDTEVGRPLFCGDNYFDVFDERNMYYYGELLDGKSAEDQSKAAHKFLHILANSANDSGKNVVKPPIVLESDFLGHMARQSVFSTGFTLFEAMWIAIVRRSYKACDKNLSISLADVEEIGRSVTKDAKAAATALAPIMAVQLDMQKEFEKR